MKVKASELKGKHRCHFRRSRNLNLEASKNEVFDRVVFQKTVIKNWFYSYSLRNEEDRVKDAIRYIKSGKPKEDAEDIYAVTAVSSILRTAGFDLKDDFDELIAAIHVKLASRPRYVKAIVQDTYTEMPFETDETAYLQSVQDANLLLRYLTQEKRTPLLPESKELDIFDIDVVTKPDLLFIDERSGRIEAVKICCRRPDVKNRSKRKDASVDTSLELYALWSYAKEFIKDDKEHEIVASYYFTRKTADRKDNLKPYFFDDDNVVSISEKVKKGLRSELDENFEPQFEEYEIGETCSGETCDDCDMKELCGYNSAPLKNAVPKSKKTIRDIDLSKTQEDAVFFRKGIARVNAGAGAGKTLIVALRTAYMLEEGISPEEILLVTFTNAGAGEMKERIEMYDEDLGTGTDLESLACLTFNAFGNEIIKKEYEVLGYDKEPRLIDNIERKDILTDLLQENTVPGLNYQHFMMDLPNAKGALPICEEAFRIIKRDRLSSYAYDELKDALGRNDNHISDDAAYKALMELYEKYDSILHERALIEFADQERLLFELLDIDPYYFDSLGFKHVIVDEFQDTSDNQIKLVKKLIETAHFESLMIVGDDSQSIFSFREACPENIVDFFDKIGEDGEDIYITDNHRSTPQILDFANKLNARNLNRVEKDLIATRPDGKEPIVKGFFKKEEEYKYIADVIKEKVSEGVELDDIAVIAATQKELLDISGVLTEEGIESILQAPIPMLDNSRVQGLISLAKAYLDENATKDILIFQNCIFGGGVLKHDDKTLQSFIEEGKSSIKEVKKLFGPKKVEAFESLCLDIAGDDDLALQLVERISRFYTVDDRIDYLRKFERFGGEKLKREGKYSGVVLSTAHSSKGLEWPVVINSISKYDRNGLSLVEQEERRRLFFVSATRARDELYITGQIKLSGNKTDGFVYNRFVVEAHEILETPLSLSDKLKEASDEEDKAREDAKKRVKKRKSKKKEES